MSQTVSVIIAAYNAQDFIHRAIESAAAQSLRPLEIIVIDDCSNDGTCGAVQSIAAKYEDGFIKLLRLPVNGGPSAARNAGIRAARGDWIAVLDADDAYFPARLETLVREATARNADIIADNMCYWNPHTDIRSAPLFRDEVKIIDLDMFLQHSFPREGEADYGLLKPVFLSKFLNNYGLFYAEDTRHGEDFLFILEALFKNARYVFVPTLGYLYSSRDTGLSRTQVNYRKIVEDTEKICVHPGIKDNPEALRALQKRAKSAGELADAQDMSVWFKSGDGRKVAAFAFQSPRNFFLFAKKSLLYATKKMGLKI
jgi:succinoglycan biosynthesis protein ExoO